MRNPLLIATALTTTIGFLVPGGAAAASPYDWSGFYAGLGLGATKSDDNVTFDYDGSSSGLPTSVDVPALGKDVSLRLGRNWQNGSFVYGFEADGGLLSLGNTVTGSNYAIQDSLTALLSLRARYGVAFDRLMVYGDLGFAAGDAGFTAHVGDAGKGTSATGKGIVLGTVVGVGGEYALTDKVSLTAEAQYYGLSPLTGHGVYDNGYGTNNYTANYVPKGAIFQAGVNVHF